MTLLSRAAGKQFLRFCVIGAVGFLADAGVLLLLVHDTAMGAIAARLVSFAVAVLVTFELNRRWTFRDAASIKYWNQLASYVGVQSLGFACNFAIYTGLYLLLPPDPSAPLAALAVASALALFVNFIGARLLVFGRRPRVPNAHVTLGNRQI